MSSEKCGESLGPGTRLPRFSVVVPVFNEADLIRETLRRLREVLPPDHEVLLCYDHDEDTTLPVARAVPPEERPDQLRFVKNELGPGVRFAIEAGMRAARSPIVVVAMADLSDDLDRLEEMVARAEAGADVVCASRYMPGGRQIGGPWLKGKLSRLAGLSLHALVGLPTRDPSNSFKAYRRDFLERTPIETRAGFALGMELVVKAHFAGSRVEEVPATWWDRTAGESRFRLLRWLPSYLRWYAYALRSGLASHVSNDRAREGLRKAWPALALLAALALACIVHWPLLRLYFHADDYVHLYRAAVDDLPKFLLRTHGGHLLGVWRATFWLYRDLFGLQTELWFAAVIATHLLNVGLLYGTIRSLTGSVGLAGGASALWGVSPLARGSLGWLSVYPHVLLTTWVLWALFDVVRVARRQYEPSVWTILRWIVLMLLAANSFGIGLGVAMAFPFSCALLLRASDLRPGLRLALFALLILVPVNLLCMGWLDPEPLIDMAAVRRSNVLDVGWTLFVAPLELLAWLVAYASAAAAVGPLLDLSPRAALSVAVGPLAGTPFETASLLIAATAIGIAVAVTLLLIRADARTRRDAVAFLLLTAACYEPVAIGRWWATPDFLPGSPDAAVWTRIRYHYLGPALVWLTLCSLFAALPHWTVRHRRSLAVVGFAWIGLATGWSLEAASDFTPGDPERDRRRFERTAASIEQQILQTPPGETAYVANLPFRFLSIIPEGHFPGWAAVYAIIHPENEFEGRRVRFVESDEELLEVVRRREGERILDLLVSPAEVPPRARPKGPARRRK